MYEETNLKLPNYLLTKDSSKILKTNKVNPNQVTYMIYMLPADKWQEYFSPEHIARLKIKQKTLCPFADEAGCKAPCLNTSGHGAFDQTQMARLKRTMLFLTDRERFFTMLVGEILTLKAKLDKSKTLSLRLNGTSDIMWENERVTIGGQTYPNIMAYFTDVQFYDYTKITTRKIEHIPNYHLTWSYSEAKSKYADRMHKAFPKHNVAVVFRKEIPATFKGIRVISGDESDARFLDPKHVIVGLLAKGKAKKDVSGFVIN
jgi:hypothetical protein